MVLFMIKTTVSNNSNRQIDRQRQIDHINQRQKDRQTCIGYLLKHPWMVLMIKTTVSNHSNRQIYIEARGINKLYKLEIVGQTVYNNSNRQKDRQRQVDHIDQRQKDRWTCIGYLRKHPWMVFMIKTAVSNNSNCSSFLNIGSFF